MYGIVYKMLNTLFQMCSLTVAKVPLDEKNFKLFNCNSSLNIWTSTCNFRSYGTKEMHCLITNNDAEGLMFLNFVFVYTIYQTEQMISVKYP